ncbi:MAG TPA: choice-of-anchor Q domain-containing protein, partial [Syntrophobacteraceae bacterium]|nr:choice-of-anchor Q domain-containing protein [Syntrophobacteraceae bacterium]
ENFSITQNLIHDTNNIGIDAIGYEGVALPAGARCRTELCDRARNGAITANTVYNITSNNNPVYGKKSYSADGIYVDGGTGILIDRNLVYNTDIGIEMASENPGGKKAGVEKTDHVIARNNVIYHCNAVGISIGGYAAGNGPGGGGTGSCTIVNNTLFENDTANTGSGEFQIGHNATGNIFKNNILYAGTQGLFVNDYTASEPNPAGLDYNIYFSSSGASNGMWVWQGKTYTGYSSYRSKTGKDSHSLFSDPQFKSVGTPPNLDINSSSPAENAGINLGSGVEGAVDFAGNPRTRNGSINIGAYEQ